jgi:integrase
MSARFLRLTREALRDLAPGQTISEHGITAEKLPGGDTRWSIGVMVDGKRIHRVIGCERDGVNRGEAERVIEQLKADARTGRLSLPLGRKLPLGFEEAAKAYLVKLQQIGGKDLAKNEQHLRSHLIPYFKQQRLDTITLFTVEAFQKKCRDKGLSHATVNRILATYRRMGRTLAAWKTIPTPLPMIKLEREDNARDYVISPQEEKLLLDAAIAGSHLYIHFIQLGLGTSLRHREMLGARFENFDAENRRLKVKVKGGKWRNQPLTNSMVGLMLKEQQMAQDPTGWLFPSKTSTTGHLDNLSDPFAHVVKTAGLDPKVIIPHTMRHTAITRFAETTQDLKLIMAFSGHTSIQMAMRYVHKRPRIVDAALDKFEEQEQRDTNNVIDISNISAWRDR